MSKANPMWAAWKSMFLALQVAEVTLDTIDTDRTYQGLMVPRALQAVREAITKAEATDG